MQVLMLLERWGDGPVRLGEGVCASVFCFLAAGCECYRYCGRGSSAVSSVCGFESASTATCGSARQSNPGPHQRCNKVVPSFSRDLSGLVRYKNEVFRKWAVWRGARTKSCASRASTQARHQEACKSCSKPQCLLVSTRSQQPRLAPPTPPPSRAAAPAARPGRHTARPGSPRTPSSPDPASLPPRACALRTRPPRCHPRPA